MARAAEDLDHARTVRVARGAHGGDLQLQAQRLAERLPVVQGWKYSSAGLPVVQGWR